MNTPQKALTKHKHRSDSELVTLVTARKHKGWAFLGMGREWYERQKIDELYQLTALGRLAYCSKNLNYLY